MPGECRTCLVLNSNGQTLNEIESIHLHSMNWRKNRLSTVDEVGEHQFDVSSDDDELMNPFDDVREQFELLKTVRRNVLKSIDEETEVKFCRLRKKNLSM